MSRRVVIGIVLVIIIVVAGVAVWILYPWKPPMEYEKTLIIAIPEEPEGMDIQQITWSNEIHALIFQPLVQVDTDMNIVPDLATRFEISEDGKTITFYLPEDAKFSNGDPITPQAIKESVWRYKTISPWAEDYAAVTDIVAVDNAAKFILSEPAPYLWAVLTTEYGGVVNARVAEEVGNEEFNRFPVASGPYMVKEWVRGSHVVLVRNENYTTNLPFVENKGPNPYIDEIIIKFVPEDLTRISELSAGKVHVIRGVPFEYVPILKQDPDINLYETIAPGLSYIDINMLRPPLNDSRVRKAIMLAIDRDELVSALANTTIARYSFFAPTMVCYNESVEEYARQVYAHDVEEAKRLLSEAGWVDTDGDGIVDKNGQPLVLELLDPYDRPALHKVAPLIQSQLAKIGIKIELRTYSMFYIGDLEEAWNFDMALEFFVWADPDIYTYQIHSEVANATYKNLKVDQLLVDGRVAVNYTERTIIYSRMQQILLKDLPFIPLLVNKGYTAFSKNVQGLIIIPPYGGLILNDVKIVKAGAQGYTLTPLYSLYLLFFGSLCLMNQKIPFSTYIRKTNLK